MDPHQIFISAASCLSVLIYATRLNAMTWRTHRFRCVSAQMSGAILACGLIYWASDGMSPGWLYPVLLVLLAHLSVTSERWQSGPPPETETRPMPLEGLQQ